MARVYPRERGGTVIERRSATIKRGLSPRTRGNPRFAAVAAPLSGSIPANAGEPQARPRPETCLWVYPRERGGTAGGDAVAHVRAGLSPRTRGNR